MAEVGQAPSSLNGHTGQPITRLVFWHNMVSNTHWPYIQELADQFGYAVEWVSLGSSEQDMRAKMGWPNLEESNLKLRARPSLAEQTELLGRDEDTTLHIFANPTGDPIVKDVFVHASKGTARLAIVGYAPRPNKVPALMKSAAQNHFRWKYGHRIEFVFAIGKLAEKWYRESGYTQQQIVPWGYFPPTPKLPERATQNVDFEFVFADDMIERCGPDVLFKALAFINTKRWRLTVIGDGHLSSRCMAIAQQLGVGSQVEFKRAMPFDQKMQIIAGADLVVVPSRYDGWGPGVTESLLCGVPVVCTDMCGASDLCSDPLHGTVVPADDPAALGKALDHWLTVGKLDGVKRNRIADWAKCISASAAAERFHGAVSRTAESQRLAS